MTTRNRFRPGQSGNPAGRPRGSRNRATVLRDQLREQDGQRLLEVLRAKALAGDVESLKFLLGRILPPAKDLPEPPTSIRTSGSLSEMAQEIVQAALAGQITDERTKTLVEALVRVSAIRENEELETRLRALEERGGIL